MKRSYVSSEFSPAYKRYSYLYIPVLFLLTSVILDVCMYGFMGLPFASDYIYSLAIMVVLAALICLTQRKWLQITLCSILLAGQTFFCVCNIICYINLGEVFSLESFSAIVNAIVASKSGTHYSLGMIVSFVAVAVVYVVGVILIAKLCKSKIVKKRILQPILCAVLIVSAIMSNLICYWTLPKYNSSYTENLSNKKFVHDTFMSNRITNLSAFGTYSYYLNNLLYLFNWKTSVAKVFNIQVNSEFVADTDGYENVAQLGEGDNLIMILMETFEKVAVDPLIMPNLYNFMVADCTQVDGYYSVERTCMTDYITQTGLHALGREMYSNYSDVEIPFSLANIFKRSGYVTSAFHNYKGSVYNRNVLHTQSLGFDHFYDYTTLSERDDVWFNGNKDELLFTENLDKIAPSDENFYSYVISISTHAASSLLNLESTYPEEFAYINAHLDELAETFPLLKSENKGQVQMIKNYLAGAISFDNGFGALLERLSNTTGKDGRLLIESTAIVMFGDHYYYMSPGIVDGTPAVNGDKCPLIIYNPKAPEAQPDENGEQVVDGRVITRFSATMDIYKTTCSLFGIVTDQQLTLGHSVYSDTPTIGIGYLNNRIWGEDWYTTDFVSYEGRTLTADERTYYMQIADEVFAKIIANMKVYQDKDGFKKLTKCYYTLPQTSNV